MIVLENIFRHLEMGEPPEVAAEKGGDEVALAVLAATLTSSVVFFPVTFLYGVSRFLFSALALAVVLALFASYFVAMTVVPLFCAKFLKAPHRDQLIRSDVPSQRPVGLADRFNRAFASRFEALLAWYERRVRASLAAPRLGGRRHHGDLPCQPRPLSVPWRGVLSANRRRPVRDEREIAVRHPHRGDDGGCPQGRSRSVRRIVDPHDLDLIVSNIGVQPGFSSIYTSNAGPHTSTVQVALKEDHRVGSYEYMDRVRTRHSTGAAAVERVLPVGWHGGCRAESGTSRTHRRAVERLEHRGSVQGRQRHVGGRFASSRA